ncbi:MAG: hypothetical protein IJ939_05615 [Clostridia bacterium]|nr:hypothetical protein [Clostridia bacterium]
MKNKLSGFIAGIMVTILVLSASFAVFGDNLSKKVEIVYRNIKICIDGTFFEPKDAGGNPVEPFILDGTTYLPVRAVANAIGKDVAWDSSTSTVYLGKKPELPKEETEKNAVTTPEVNKDLIYAEDFSVSRTFSDSMVVQRGEKIRVFGFAGESENGKYVSASFKGMTADAKIENGEWCITFPDILKEDTTPAEMKIYTDKKTITFKDVLVGDVYMLLGQSNVRSSIKDAGETPEGNENAPIRLNHATSVGDVFPKRGTDYVYKDYLNTKQWTRATAKDISDFSAVGYYFAKELAEKTQNKIPVGVIEIAFGGVPLGSFLPNEVAEKYDTDTLNPKTGLYVTTGVNSDEFEGRYLYNCHIAPWEKYAIAGLIWYQGESDYIQSDAVRYNEVFSALIEHMRGTHNLVKRDFPVFVMEFPSIYKKPSDFTGTWHFMDLGMIRAYMGTLPVYINNCYVIPSSDLWGDRTYFNSLHPLCKHSQGLRAADFVQSVVLGTKKLSDVSGPVFESAEISADKKTAVITFTNVGTGLATKDGSKNVKGIVGLADKLVIQEKVIPVSSVITAKDKITVKFDSAIKAVAYNYDSQDFFGETLNLCSDSGIPATAFLSPMENENLKDYTKADFVAHNAEGLGYTKWAFDTLVADGTPLLEKSHIADKLNAVGNKVEIPKGTASVDLCGWVGFSHPIAIFGYLLDDEKAVLKTYADYTNDAILKAGGDLARKYTVKIDTSALSQGKHTANILAFVDYNGGTVVKLISFDIIVTEPIKEEPIPEGTSFPNALSYEYGFVKNAFDLISFDGTQYLKQGVATKLKNAQNTATVKKSTKIMELQGWIGLGYEIDVFGYAIDGKAAINSPVAATQQAVKDAGGQYARRFLIKADISTLSAGKHTFDILVRIKKDGKTEVLKIHSFTLDVTE